MKAKWKGEENGNSTAVVFGVSFRGGDWVDVSHLPADQLAKLANNHFFEVDGEMKRKPGRPPKDPQQQQQAEEV